MTKALVTGVCKLCQQSCPLLKSHVLPEFLYKDTGVYDPKHRFVNVPKLGSSEKPKMEQQGLRERLLCKSCEVHLSKFENYAKQIVADMQASPIPTHTPAPTPADATVISSVDYIEFKLFLMSLVWRAGVASGEMWEAVDLGAHEARLRMMILASDPGKPAEYGCLIVRRSDIPQPFKRGLVAPMRHRSTGGHTCYFFVFAGMGWRIWVSGHTSQLPTQLPFLTPVGDLYIFPDFDDLLQRTNQALKMAKTQKKRHP